MGSERDIEKIVQLVKNRIPDVNIEQLRVTHPADDNGIWFFWMSDTAGDDIQIESSYGKCPFLIETNRNGHRRIGNTIEETVGIICSHLENSPL